MGQAHLGKSEELCHSQRVFGCFLLRTLLFFRIAGVTAVFTEDVSPGEAKGLCSLRFGRSAACACGCEDSRALVTNCSVADSPVALIRSIHAVHAPGMERSLC